MQSGHETRFIGTRVLFCINHFIVLAGRYMYIYSERASLIIRSAHFGFRIMFINKSIHITFSRAKCGYTNMRMRWRMMRTAQTII